MWSQSKKRDGLKDLSILTNVLFVCGLVWSVYSPQLMYTAPVSIFKTSETWIASVILQDQAKVTNFIWSRQQREVLVRRMTTCLIDGSKLINSHDVNYLVRVMCAENDVRCDVNQMQSMSRSLSNTMMSRSVTDVHSQTNKVVTPNDKYGLTVKLNQDLVTDGALNDPEISVTLNGAVKSSLQLHDSLNVCGSDRTLSSSIAPIQTSSTSDGAELSTSPVVTSSYSARTSNRSAITPSIDTSGPPDVGGSSSMARISTLDESRIPTVSHCLVGGGTVSQSGADNHGEVACAATGRGTYSDSQSAGRMLNIREFVKNSAHHIQNTALISSCVKRKRVPIVYSTWALQSTEMNSVEGCLPN